jgi:hypothetical protein
VPHGRKLYDDDARSPRPGRRKHSQLPSAETIDKERRALEARRDGWSYDEIADKITGGVRANAYRVVQNGLRRTLVEPALELRVLEQERLDALLRPVMLQAKDGNLRAVETALRIMERRARLLGLDLPAKGENPELAEVKGLLGRMAEEFGTTPPTAGDDMDGV